MHSKMDYSRLDSLTLIYILGGPDPLSGWVRVGVASGVASGVRVVTSDLIARRELEGGRSSHLES
jgi:hypothetical protein